MEYKHSGHESLARPTIERLLAAIERHAEWSVGLAGPAKALPLVDILGHHGVALRSPGAFVPLEPADAGFVMHRDRNRKRVLYYFPRTRTFARGTLFGNQSSFRMIDAASDIAGIAEQLLCQADFNRVVAGMEPTTLDQLVATAALPLD